MSNEDTELSDAKREVQDALREASAVATAATSLSAQLERLRVFLTNKLKTSRLLLLIGMASLLAAIMFNTVDATLREQCGTSHSIQCFFFQEPTDQQIARNSELRDQQYDAIRTQQDKEIAALQFVGLYFDFALPDNLITGPDEPFDERLTDRSYLRQLVNEQRRLNAEAEARQAAGG